MFEIRNFLVVLIILGIFTESNARDSITVNFFLLEDCKICQYYSHTIHQLYEDYNDEHTTFIGYFPNRYSSEKNISEFKEKYDIPFKLKKEFFQTKTQKYKVTVTPEVIIYNETRKKILYQGRIDNSYQKLGVRRRIVTKRELEDALKAIADDREIQVKKTEAVGCLVTLVDSEF